MQESIRNDWTFGELADLYAKPLLALISEAHRIHLQFHDPIEVQMCHLLSIKTGGCPEDCKYCAQSSRYQTPVSPEPFMQYEQVLAEARKTLARGGTRICLGAAWRAPREGKQFDAVLEMIKGVARLGLEVCCTLGMLTEEQALKLKAAGLYSYNHNLDTSESFYPTIITTRTYQERLDTLDIVKKTGLNMCCGGIIGMGETSKDRLELLLVLCNRTPHPDSVPINRLSAVPGTPFEDLPKMDFWELLKIVAVARIVMPKAMVRLSAGREVMSTEQQALCFLAGANSIFIGEKLLTVANAPIDRDEAMFQLLGLKKRKPYQAAR